MEGTTGPNRMLTVFQRMNCTGCPMMYPCKDCRTVVSMVRIGAQPLDRSTRSIRTGVWPR